ncbi:MAG: molybdopterin-guanine dinucleotide biosynthesis protein B [Pseudomonadota bacterium]
MRSVGPSPHLPRGQNVFGIVGWKNAGKTTVTERLVAEFTRRGRRVSTIKRAHHDADVDEPGRDTYRHRRAGAQEVALVTEKRWALMHECGDEPEPTLTDILGRMGPADLILVEGFKGDPHPKLEVRSEDAGPPGSPDALHNIIAYASDTPIPDSQHPLFRRDDITGIADFIEKTLGLAP